MRTFAFVVFLLAGTVGCHALEANQVKKNSSGFEVISGPCQGLVGVSMQHVTVRCNCMTKLGGRVFRDGSVNTRGIPDRQWFACVGR